MMFPVLVPLLAYLSLAGGFIIPEELPSFLSLVYSNIPPIKKGTDSRFGVGFRLGPHADFQVLLEVGPQKETGALGPNAEPSGKRETLQMQNTDALVTMINTWKMPPQYSGGELEVQDTGGGEMQMMSNDLETVTEKISPTTGGGWLSSWKNSFSKGGFFGKIKFKPVPGLDSRSDRRRTVAHLPTYFRRPVFRYEDPGYVEHLQRLWHKPTLS